MTESKTSTVAAVRGAITVAANEGPAILDATARLLEALLSANALEAADMISALFTATADLDADFPAHAARRMGWRQVPMLCAREIPVPGALERVVRVLLTVRVSGARALQPVYLDSAAALRPDLRQSPPATAARRRVAIIGLGQIGGSIGLALRDRGWIRSGFDTDAGTLAAARAAGAIDESAGSAEAACSGADLAVVAVPMDAMPAAIDAAAAALPRGAALLDTGSARAPLTSRLAAAVRRGIAAVGGHPLAGTEHSGFTAAREDLFRSAPFVLLPAGGSIPDTVRELLRDLGATETLAQPELHDRALARTSHLPWLLSDALATTGAQAAAAGLAGPGFRDMTRLARSDRRMATGYCRANAREVSAAWDELRAVMDARVAALTAPGSGDRV